MHDERVSSFLGTRLHIMMVILFHFLLKFLQDILHLEILKGHSFSFTTASSCSTMKVAWAGITALRRIKSGDRIL